MRSLLEQEIKVAVKKSPQPDIIRYCNDTPGFPETVTSQTVRYSDGAIIWMTKYLPVGNGHTS